VLSAIFAAFSFSYIITGSQNVFDNVISKRDVATNRKPSFASVFELIFFSSIFDTIVFLAGLFITGRIPTRRPVDDLALMKRAYANKKTGQIDDGLVREVVNVVQTQVQDEVSQLQTEDDASTASTNLSRFRINEIVESSVPKKKGRLVGLGRRTRDPFLGIFRGTRSSEFSEGSVPRKFPMKILKNISSELPRIGPSESPSKYPE
ncbi:unnamed protein product, partial [Brassica oleracea var. botrytis]